MTFSTVSEYNPFIGKGGGQSIKCYVTYGGLIILSALRSITKGGSVGKNG